MSDERHSRSGESTQLNRRESDQTGRASGIQSGGRRKSDRGQVRPRSRAAQLAIAGSFLFSAGLVAWAFTLPFRSNTLGTESDGRNLPPVKLANQQYEARLSASAYVDYTRELDRRMLEQWRDKNKVSEVKHSSSEAVLQWKKRVQERQQQLQAMQREWGPEPFKEGSLEWQNQQDLQEILDDAPPGA